MPPPLPELLAFLATVKDQPEDNVPRFILADWLAEQGDPRGELIRLSVEATRREIEYEEFDTSEEQDENTRLWQALQEEEERWLRPLEALAGSAGRAWL